MRSAMFGVVAYLTTMLAGYCCGSSFMELGKGQSSKSYTIRKGVTPREFFGASVKSVPGPDMKVRLDGDVWEVWDFTVNRRVPNYDDVTSNGNGSYYLSHQEFVAFKNGRMEDWGWGKLPRLLKENRERVTPVPQ